jgi:hypothetical protein
MKSLKFGEDVRPPYQGTFTKTLPESAASKLMRNPFHRGLPDINYDYDSEAEWEEPEEGEDLDSEEEEEGSEEGDDDLDGFLDDDEDNVEGKRRLIVGDLEPLSTGLRWQFDGGDHELEMYRIQTITDSVTFPIDPFSTAYWQKPKPAEQLPTGGVGRTTLHSFMVVPPSTQSQTAAPTTEGVAPTLLTASGKAKRTLTPEQLAEFKEVVNGSDLTKTGLIEVLKKRYKPFCGPRTRLRANEASLDFQKYRKMSLRRPLLRWQRGLDRRRLRKSGCATRRANEGQYQREAARYTLPRFAKMGVYGVHRYSRVTMGNSQDVCGLSVCDFRVICGKAA